MNTPPIIPITITAIKQDRRRYARKSTYTIFMMCDKDYFRVNDVVQLIGPNNELIGEGFRVVFMDNGHYTTSAQIESMKPFKKNSDMLFQIAIAAYKSMSVAANK